MRTWIVTDGKAGDEMPCLGLAERLGLEPEMRHVAPGAPWSWLMPWGPVDPCERPSRPGSPIAPPFPDLLIASGRRSVPYLRHVRRASDGQTLTVFLKDPRTGPRTADIIWAPEHDEVRSDGHANVIVTLTSPHRISPERLKAARMAPPEPLAALDHPRVAVLLGGNSRHHRFSRRDIARLIAHLTALTQAGAKLMVTASRRTPPKLRDGAFALAVETGGYAWDGQGENPYIAMLALADVIVATADSTNMLGEAAATGTGILVFEPSGGHRKVTRMLHLLQERGITRPLTGKLDPFTYPPLDSTPILADAVRSALLRRGHNVNALPEDA